MRQSTTVSCGAIVQGESTPNEIGRWPTRKKKKNTTVLFQKLQQPYKITFIDDNRRKEERKEGVSLFTCLSLL